MTEPGEYEAAMDRIGELEQALENWRGRYRELANAINAYFDGTIQNLECFGHPDVSTLLSGWQYYKASARENKR